MKLVDSIPTAVEVRSVLARHKREATLLRRLLSIAQHKEANAIDPDDLPASRLLQAALAALRAGDRDDARFLLAVLHKQHGIALTLACDLECEVSNG